MEHPILFSTEMVKAILEGRKSQTRRVIKPQPPISLPEGVYLDSYNHTSDWCFWYPDGKMANSIGPNDKTAMWRCPYGQASDKLWVRETWMYKWVKPEHGTTNDIFYKASDPDVGEAFKWHPSIFMPRWASRLTLEITEIRVQRLQEISEEDAIAEGTIRFPTFPTSSLSSYCYAYRNLWDSINGKTHPWESSPWVWAISFKLLEGTK